MTKPLPYPEVFIAVAMAIGILALGVLIQPHVPTQQIETSEEIAR